MTQELATRKEQPLITATPFEKLLTEIRRAEPKDKIEWLWATDDGYAKKLVVNICTVYYYLTHVCGMNKEDMTYEEYTIAREHLDQVAREEVKRCLRGIKKIFYLLGLKSCWHRYLKEGWFGIKTPWGDVGVFHWHPRVILNESTRHPGIIPLNIKILLEKAIEEQILKK